MADIDGPKGENILTHPYSTNAIVELTSQGTDITRENGGSLAPVIPNTMPIFVFLVSTSLVLHKHTNSKSSRIKNWPIFCAPLRRVEMYKICGIRSCTMAISLIFQLLLFIPGFGFNVSAFHRFQNLAEI